jgi:hypothetical protein
MFRVRECNCQVGCAWSVNPVWMGASFILMRKLNNWKGNLLTLLTGSRPVLVDPASHCTDGDAGPQVMGEDVKNRVGCTAGAEEGLQSPSSWLLPHTLQ